MKPLVYSFVFAGCVFLHGYAASGENRGTFPTDDARAYFEVLRSDFNAGKIRVINQVMKLSAAEADKFWPIYRGYEKDLAAVGDRKLALIREFMNHHRGGTLDDQNSAALAGQWLQNSQDRLDLWKKYNQQISKALSPIRAAQFLQVENQIAIFVDLNIASEMPVIGATGERQPRQP